MSRGIPRTSRLQLACAAALAYLSFTVASASAASDLIDRELAYAREVQWRVHGAAELEAMEPTIRSILDLVHVRYRGVDGQVVEGFYPGADYNYSHIPGWTPFYLYARDTATILPMARYYYGPAALRSAVEEFVRFQDPDGALSATIGPDLKIDKATAVSDEETSCILAAAVAYDAAPDPAWLTSDIRGQPLVERLNRAMAWVLDHRYDPGTGLIKRAHTTDWGDIKWEAGDNPTDIQPGDQWTASIYDQAIAYGALKGLARLNDAASRPQDAHAWEAAAAALRPATDAALWQDEPERGYYRIHVHLEPDTLLHSFDEGDIVAIGNAAAVYYGLAEAERVPRILAALERARLAAGAPKVGLTLDPPYEGWQHSQMGPRVYQNGALWDWWAGRQITAEFKAGYRRMAAEHLLALARDWASHPGQVREWESPWLGRTGMDQAYAGAAGVVGQAVVEGLFGVELRGKEVLLTPRLGDRPGMVRIYQPSGDLYAAYRYEPTATRVTLAYGSNSPTALSVRLPFLWRGEAVAYLDRTERLPFGIERSGEDRLAVLTVPSGTHQVDLFRVRRQRGGPQ